MPRVLNFYGPTNQYVILTRLLRFGQVLTPAEFKVLMFIYDRTLGYRKVWESIPYRHFFHGIISKDQRMLHYGVGLGETTLKRSIRSLESYGIIRRQRANHSWYGTYYAINTRWVPHGIHEPWAPEKFEPSTQDEMQIVSRD